jgi:hypothetical protein
MAEIICPAPPLALMTTAAATGAGAGGSQQDVRLGAVVHMKSTRRSRSRREKELSSPLLPCFWIQ